MALTDQQASFVDYFVAGGHNATEAARAAGYAHPKQEAYRLTRMPHVQLAIRAEQARLIGGDLTNLSLSTLAAILRDGQAPASARVAAGRTVLEMGGWFRQHDGAGDLFAGKPRSTADLEKLIAMLERQAQGLGTMDSLTH